MITDEIGEKINRGEIYEEELRVLVYSFAQTISKTAKYTLGLVKYVRG